VHRSIDQRDDVDAAAAHELAAELAALLASAARGDERAWRRIVDLYARRVFALARSRLGGSSTEAEEVTQSVFCTVASKLSSGAYAEQGRFEAWLFRVAMNRVRDELRRRSRQAVATDPESLDARASAGAARGGSVSDSGPAEHEARDGELVALRGAMARLGDDDREVIELRHHAGMSFQQIADVLEEPLGTLLARHHRALRKLKDLLTHQSGDEPSTDDAARLANGAQR
jgi:RNA polymerase sigma-70 factor, ECF subfamily